jgi:hypothetical protein
MVGKGAGLSNFVRRVYPLKEFHLSTVLRLIKLAPFGTDFDNSDTMIHVYWSKTI